ncbi:hypothetical protein CDAR_369531 [Caerostris darwini]|uniref:Uncharacterized protein n=1 Tax=Caerostris darwini TaxID=1538125 RepID=A0AAV4S0N6_9ARAC|nr:hypothetical protein CDAR_369531 [Caerostris darwini]
MHLQDTKSSPIATNEYCTSTISGDTLQTFLREPQVTDYVKWYQLLRCLKMVWGMGLVRLPALCFLGRNPSTSEGLLSAFGCRPRKFTASKRVTLLNETHTCIRRNACRVSFFLSLALSVSPS